MAEQHSTLEIIPSVSLPAETTFSEAADSWLDFEI